MKKNNSSSRRKVAKFKKANAEFVKEVLHAAKAGDPDTIRESIKENMEIFLTIFGLSSYTATRRIGEQIKSQGSIELRKDDVIKLTTSPEDINRESLHDSKGFLHDSKGFLEAIG